MKADTKQHVEQCAVCQKNKSDAMSSAGLLHQPFPILEQVLDDILMDLIEGLPKSGEIDSILVVVDRLSKYGHFLGLKHPYTAKTVAEKYIKGVVKLCGFPRSIVSDRDKIFLSHFWTKLFCSQGGPHSEEALWTTLKQMDRWRLLTRKLKHTYVSNSERPKQWAS
ncbi:putative integrase [Cucumis melo var. makuwa]|uniref:Integrase n=1 Tax=Cucumis melo var. makuwa TaxID=1194695 RepID=A0A5D3BAH9_CUCMM|nr:putative integrase [Cucumis melo var. makuwa]TYJ96283.1 putative integrase [Cucumis melo var. makuwa]